MAAVESLKLECKPDFDQAMKRVDAWYDQEIIDRAPIRFTEHNAEYHGEHAADARPWPSLKDRWFDAEYQVDRFIRSIEGRTFCAETFPVYWPNLGPGVYAAFFGADLQFGDVTSWSKHCIDTWDDVATLMFDPNNIYFQKIEELTRVALDCCEGRFMVGYTDLHPDMDCVADWRDSQRLCLDLMETPDAVHRLVELATMPFQSIYDHFDSLLKSHGQMSVTWMGIPSFGRMHIPSCDFSTLISRPIFEEFCLPALRQEVKSMTHNIFHLDGKGVARHLDTILELPEINAIQWAQGVGDDQPIMQWVPLIKRIQNAGKSVVVDLQIGELESFIQVMDPRGLYLCMAAPLSDQPAIIKRVAKW